MAFPGGGGRGGKKLGRRGCGGGYLYGVEKEERGDTLKLGNNVERMQVVSEVSLNFLSPQDLLSKPS